MIVYGTRDITPDLVGAPTADLSLRDEIELNGGEILQVLSELTFKGFEARVPPALHPSHPPFASMVFYVVPESDWGPFSMAMVRVSSLAGISRFGYAVKAWIDNPEAGRELGRRFGYRFDPGVVRIHRGYDRVWGTVAADDTIVLEVGMTDPQPVAGKDVNFAGHLNIANVADDAGRLQPTLVHAGPLLAFSQCDRGKPQVVTFDADRIGLDAPYWPISAFSGHCDFKFSPVQFACDPMLPAVDRTMTLAGSMHSVG